MIGLLNAGWRWLAARDRGFAALRRAGRAAIVMPGAFALADQVLDNPQAATFAAFGAFALLLLVDFGGPMRDRLQAQAALSLMGAVFICLGTLASRNAWLAAAAMTVVALGVLFAGVVSSVLAGASASLLLAFILPVSLPGSASDIGDRLIGWALAAGASWLAVALLWPAPARDPLRAGAAAACRAIAERLRSDIAYLSSLDSSLDGAPSSADGAPVQAAAENQTAAQNQAAGERAAAAVLQLHRLFLATPYRPTGLTTGARTVVRLVDELNWLNAILRPGQAMPPDQDLNRDFYPVLAAAAQVLEHGADLLTTTRPPPAQSDSLATMQTALEELRHAVQALERHATRASSLDSVDSLDPCFRAQALSFVVISIGDN
ncbi:MAG: hypothetical protein JWO63_3143, partial [Frankiales bacterium]|nr:hypothetical protein [Frankiales bacterium]